MQVQDDLKQGVVGAVPIPSDDAGKEDVIAALVANVEAMIRADRKITALKQLQVSKTGLKIYDCLWILSFGCSWLVYMQGHIWQTGYENDELEGVVFEDVPEALEKWHALGTKVFYIPPPPFHLFFPFMSLNLWFLFFCHLKFCVRFSVFFVAIVQNLVIFMSTWIPTSTHAFVIQTCEREPINASCLAFYGV